MKDKNIIVVGIGLIVIIAIAVSIIYANNEFSAQTIKSINTMNSFLLKQKNFEIKKLVKQLDTKQKELTEMKAILDSVKEKVDSAKKDLGSITEKSATQ